MKIFTFLDVSALLGNQLLRCLGFVRSRVDPLPRRADPGQRSFPVLQPSSGHGGSYSVQPVRNVQMSWYAINFTLIISFCNLIWHVASWRSLVSITVFRETTLGLVGNKVELLRLITRYWISLVHKNGSHLLTVRLCSMWALHFLQEIPTCYWIPGSILFMFIISDVGDLYRKPIHVNSAGLPFL